MVNIIRVLNLLFLITCLVMKENLTTAQSSIEVAVQMTALRNYRSTSGALREIWARSVIECTRECSQTTGCVSFFYNKEDKICQLHDIVFQSIDPSFVYVYQTYYYKMYTDPSNFTCPLAPPGSEYNTVILSDGSTFIYRIVWDLIDFASAVLACNNDGAALVRVLTPEKMDVLIHIFTTCEGFVYAGNYWMDGTNVNATDFNNIEEWVTSSGELLSSAGQFWSAGSPLNPEIDHCVALWSGVDYLWFNRHCSFTNYYICEKF